MANPDPYRARSAKAERRQAAMRPIQEAVDKAIETARNVLDDPDPSVRLRAVHAISQIGGTYVRIHEAVELEARLEALESVIDSTARSN